MNPPPSILPPKAKTVKKGKLGKLEIGAVVEGIVDGTESFGVFIDFFFKKTQFRGLCHVSEVTTTHSHNLDSPARSLVRTMRMPLMSRFAFPLVFLPLACSLARPSSPDHRNAFTRKQRNKRTPRLGVGGWAMFA